MHDKFIDLGQHIALVIVNNCVKFEWSSLPIIEVTANVKVFVDQKKLIIWAEGKVSI